MVFSNRLGLTGRECHSIDIIFKSKHLIDVIKLICNQCWTVQILYRRYGYVRVELDFFIGRQRGDDNL